MAIRTKTIEYAFDANRAASLASATRYQFPTMSVYIPETGSRVFRSAFIELNFRDNTTSTTAMYTSSTVGIKLGNNSYSDEIIPNTGLGAGSSGEQQSFSKLRDVTSYFNTNFGSGITQSCQVAVRFDGLATNNHAAKLYLTYDYDDSADIRIKTVRIPIGSTPSSISNTLQQIGTASVPALDTFLPEVGKAYRDIWFEIQGNDGSGTVDTFLVTSLDAETAVSSAIHEHGLGSSIWHKTFWKRTDMDTSTTHSFNIGVAATSAQNRFGNVAVLLGTTYEYTHSLSSQSMNSLVFPIISEAGGVGDYIGDTSNYPYIVNSSITEKEFYINEPAPIVAKQSGLMMFYNDTFSGGDIRIAINNGAGFTRYRRLHGTLACGQYGVMHRFDQVGVQGFNALSGIRTLSDLFKLYRGKNTIKIQFDRTRSTSGTSTNASALAYINYVSNIHPSGDAVHNQTRFYAISGHRQPNRLDQYESIFAPTASLGSYYRNNAIGFGMTWMTPSLDGGPVLIVRPTDAEISASVQRGWVSLYESMVDISLERGVCTSYVDGISKFKKYPDDPNITQMDLTIPRIYRFQYTSIRSTGTGTTSEVPYYGGCTLLWTYHNIHTPVTRSVSGYPSGDGSGIRVSILKSGSNELVYNTTTTTGGEYSFVAYDANVSLYAVAYDSASGFAGSSRYFTPSI